MINIVCIAHVSEGSCTNPLFLVTSRPCWDYLYFVIYLLEECYVTGKQVEKLYDFPFGSFCIRSQRVVFNRSR